MAEWKMDIPVVIEKTFEVANVTLEKLNIMLDDEALPPVREHESDAGLDLRTPYDFTLVSGGSYAVDTGVHCEIPSGFYGKLESKSGLNVNYGIVSLGGVIDAGYTGSIVAKLYNFSEDDYTFKRGDKLVQMVIQPCVMPRLILVSEFADTERGDDGFGSTGK